jgi:hypothetical protein
MKDAVNLKTPLLVIFPSQERIANEKAVIEFFDLIPPSG